MPRLPFGSSIINVGLGNTSNCSRFGPIAEGRELDGYGNSPLSYYGNLAALSLLTFLLVKFSHSLQTLQWLLVQASSCHKCCFQPGPVQCPVDDPLNTLAFPRIKSIASIPHNPSKVHPKLCHHSEVLTPEMTNLCCPLLITSSLLQHNYSGFLHDCHFSNSSLANIHTSIAHLFCCTHLGTPQHCVKSAAHLLCTFTQV